MNAPNPIHTPETTPMPVVMVNRRGLVLATFKSKADVYRHTRMCNRLLTKKLETGEPWRGVWFRYADMAASVQPLRGYDQPTPKENPYAPGGRLSDLAAMRGQGKRSKKYGNPRRS